MRYSLIFTLEANDDLEALSVDVRKRIVKKLRYYSMQSDPLSYAKPLHGDLAGMFRFRIGDWRVIVSRDVKGKLFILYIVKVGHRKDIYETWN